MSYIKDPSSIEAKSFQIIQSIIDEEHAGYTFKDGMEESIIKRAIHTSADFDYLYNLKFSNDGVQNIIRALEEKGTIFTDTNMALSGINKRILDELGVKYSCLVNDENVAKYAKEHGITRSMAAIEYAATVEGPKVFVLGNAPTAVYKVIDMVNEGKLVADAVVGVPVGFVGAAESKQALHDSDIPAISALGRKGGSNVAAAIINAILYQLQYKTEDYQRYYTPDKKD
ncbi:cobalt-precorrin-8 methylmutase [Granulicatella sp. zg-ZJ]|uniref:cobalt-precorrin-8 methylmutase n=1 Tax=unclassified Granulicatella TaxID=2630493 RepID=UPI0013C2808D|nr:MULTISPECIES: cobalt-precorrin-8 methylmutase [unclassified Granulicatella]MBS4749718.1 cobalt-precorrin-8 methylmutase [Carnobacteriaceae bacterium zg-ZUI78]NEW61847.1 cobalt-precorrin-8 methylmutase [Granulicatella sp. zg-ZJ]NEW65921.1 cobalt-precorrin-8 methylmutase [Granulicatella sp. zg-84]QMI85149.1 cobalt-precorrin-8 methylmutase [Carnobacteriaceae bacterium zg-84]